MPANPIVDEPTLLTLLRDVDTPKTPDQVRWMCNMVLLAAHGRKVEPPFFVELINTCSTIQSLLAELQSGGRMMHLMEQLDPERENEKLDEQMNKLVVGMMAQRRKLTTAMEAVMECPTAEDTIN